VGVPNQQLTRKGKRKQSRGWENSKWVKVITNRAFRRSAKLALKLGVEEPNHKKRLGYVW